MAKGLKTGGRKKGVPNKASIERAEAIAASGLTPLDYMLKVMRESKDAGERLDAAKSAAPYVHPKLANVELTGKDRGPVRVAVRRFSAEPMDAAPLPDEGMDSARTGLPPRNSVLAPPKR